MSNRSYDIGRIQEAISLISAFARDPVAREYPATLDKRYLRHALKVVGVQERTPEAKAFEGDLAAAVAAYAQARQDGRVSLANLRQELRQLAAYDDQLAGAIEQLRRLTTGLHNRYQNPENRLARLAMEEALAKAVFASEPPPAAGMFAKHNQRHRDLAFKRSMGARRGEDAAAAAKATAKVPQPVEPSKVVDLDRIRTIVATVRDASRELDGALAEQRRAAELALEQLPKAEATNAYAAVRPGLVAAWAAIELVAAWMPGKKPSGDPNNPVGSELIPLIHAAVLAPMPKKTGDRYEDNDVYDTVPPEDQRSYLDELRMAIKAYKDGFALKAFEGRVPVEQRWPDEILAKMQPDDRAEPEEDRGPDHSRGRMWTGPIVPPTEDPVPEEYPDTPPPHPDDEDDARWFSGVAPPAEDPISAEYPPTDPDEEDDDDRWSGVIVPPTEDPFPEEYPPADAAKRTRKRTKK